MPTDTTRDLQQYELTEMERRSADDILDSIQVNNGLFLRNRHPDHFGELLRDGNGVPVPAMYEPLRGRRYCMDASGTIWRLFGEGTPKTANARDAGSPWRTDMIEIWTGHWRKVIGPDGRPTYAKCLIAIPVGKGVNEGPPPAMVRARQKGFKHPFEPPHYPSPQQIADLEGKEAETYNAILARLPEVAKATGANEADLRAQMKPPVREMREPAEEPRPKRKYVRRKPKRRSNRQAAPVSVQEPDTPAEEAEFDAEPVNATEP